MLLQVLASLDISCRERVCPFCCDFPSHVVQEKAGEWQCSMLVFDTLQHALLPDTISFNAVLSAMEKKQKWMQASAHRVLSDAAHSPCPGCLPAVANWDRCRCHLQQCRSKRMWWSWEASSMPYPAMSACPSWVHALQVETSTLRAVPSGAAFCFARSCLVQRRCQRLCQREGLGEVPLAVARTS